MGKSVSTWLMSNERVPAGFPCDRVFLRPTEKVKRDMYRGIHVWFAPTDNEGLHVPPMEAGLCGCALVAHGIPEAGMGDYAVDGKTALCYPRCDRKAAFEGVRRLAADANLREAMGAELRKWVVENIGTRRQNMERMVGLFEKAMSKTEGAA
jgi:glycosyltransferase involved in cell wall biosynthesis